MEIAMNHLNNLNNLNSVAPGLLNVRRSTWIKVGVSLLVLFGLLIWAAVTLIGALFGQAQSLAGTSPDAVRNTARVMLEQAEAVVPGAREKLSVLIPGADWGAAARGAIEKVEGVVPGTREKLGELVPSLKPETQPQRDVSGTDIGPVDRYPGLMRTQWRQEGASVVVVYEGKASYTTVLDYYTSGFTMKGFTQKIQSATSEAEAHEYQKGGERFALSIAQKPRGAVSVRIEAPLP
jgi:hypothetical protein